VLIGLVLSRTTNWPLIAGSSWFPGCTTIPVSVVLNVPARAAAARESEHDHDERGQTATPAEWKPHDEPPSPFVLALQPMKG